jgi:RimJ/RimL family protein N-acetyltransferase
MAWPVTFETDRLRAERLRADDLSELRRMHTDVRVAKYIGGVFTEEQSTAYLARNLAHWDTHRHGLWIVYERDGAEPIGRALLRHLMLDDVDEVETGYAFYEPYWGRGYATEGTRACLALGFEQLRLKSIVAVTTPDNAASQHVLQKCGFRTDRHFERDDKTLALWRVDAP